MAFFVLFLNTNCNKYYDFLDFRNKCYNGLCRGSIEPLRLEGPLLGVHLTDSLQDPNRLRT